MAKETCPMLVSINNAKFSYGQEIRSWELTLDNIEIIPATLTIVSGSNMSGKSTFLSILGGMEWPKVMLEPAIIAGKPAFSPEALRSIAVLLSNADKMFPALSVWDNVRIALAKSSRSAEHDKRQQCRDILSRSDVFAGKSIDDPLGSLSTGGQSLVKLCRAQLAEKPLIIVDELTSYLDDDRARFFLDLALNHIARGAALVIVSHSQRDRDYLIHQAASGGYTVNKWAVMREGNRSFLETQPA